MRPDDTAVPWHAGNRHAGPPPARRPRAADAAHFAAVIFYQPALLCHGAASGERAQLLRLKLYQLLLAVHLNNERYQQNEP